MRIALAQTCPVIAEPGTHKAGAAFSTLEANLLDARDRVHEAAAAKADVVVFPEYFLQGLLDDQRQYLAYPSAFLVKYLARLAVENDISIVGTIIHPAYHETVTLPSADPFSHLPTAPSSSSSTSTSTSTSTSSSSSPPGAAIAEWETFIAQHPGTNHDPSLHNTAFFIEGGTGKLVDEYIKRSLWHPERNYLKKGEEDHRVFDTKWGRCGFVICWDAAHPFSGQALADLGADIVFAPTYWIGYDSAPAINSHNADPPAYERELITSLSYVRSFETETLWVMCNAGGPAGEGYIGGSGVWMPFKGKLGGVEGVEAGMAVVDVDLSVIKDARKLYKIREERNATMDEDK